MDIERTIEFILDHQAKAAAQLERQATQLATSTAEHDRRLAEHDRSLAEHDRSLAEHDRSLAEQDRLLDKIDRRLDRAIWLSVQDARAERKRRQEMDARFDEKITQLAAAQLVTEEKLQHLIASLGRATNGGRKEP